MLNRIFDLKMTVVILLLFLSGCKPKIKTEKPEELIPVRVNRIVLSDLAQTIDYVGDIKAQDEAVVYPRVSGKVIEKVLEDGSPVRKGEVIAYIDRDEVGLKFEKAPVESPLTGVVGRIYVDNGVNVSDQTPVALVVNMEKVKIQLDVPERYLAKIFMQQEAKIAVDAYPQLEFKGVVTKISPVVDLATRTAPVEITVDNPERILKSGMFAKVSLVIEQRQRVPVVLKEALLGKAPDLYVYIIVNNKAVFKKVLAGIHQGPYYEVREGLQEGDLVVVMGQQRLYDNAPVVVEEEGIRKGEAIK